MPQFTLARLLISMLLMVAACGMAMIVWRTLPIGPYWSSMVLIATSIVAAAIAGAGIGNLISARRRRDLWHRRRNSCLCS